MNCDVVRHLPQIPPQDFADSQVAEKNRRARIERADPRRFQPKRVTRDGTVQYGGIFQSNKIRHWFATLSRQFQLDVGPGDKRLEPGQRASEEPRLHHPELGFIRQQRPRLPYHSGRYDHVLVIRAQGDSLDDPELDVAQPDAGLLGLQSGRAVEPDRDFRATLRQGIPGEPRGHQSGYNWNGPDQRNAPPLLRSGANDRDRYFIAHARSGAGTKAADLPARSQIILGSKVRAANMVRITLAAKATAPGPGIMVTTAPN